MRLKVRTGFVIVLTEKLHPTEIDGLFLLSESLLLVLEVDSV